MKTKPKRVYLESIGQAELMASLSDLPHDPLGHRKVAELREFTGIDSWLPKRQSDLKQALEIARFASKAWRHDGFNSNPKKKDALTVLHLAGKGHSFSCVQFASVFVQLCHSVGIPARSLQICTRRPDLGSSGHAHLTAEYFDNDLGKWVWLDPQIHAYAVMKGVPLSFTEFSELVASGQEPKVRFSDRTLEYVKGDRSAFRGLENFLLRYVWSAGMATPGFFFTSQGGVRLTTCSRKGVLPSITFQGFAQKPRERLSREFFDAPVNSTLISFESLPPKKSVEWKGVDDYRERAHLNFARPELKIQLGHNMPWFDHYRLKVNGRVSRLQDGSFVLKLKPGRNRIEIAAVNQAGRTGPKSEAVIRYDSAYPSVRNFW